MRVLALYTESRILPLSMVLFDNNNNNYYYYYYYYTVSPKKTSQTFSTVT